MAQHAKKVDRSGDELYTPYKVVEKIVDEFNSTFSEYDYIWCPFNSEDKQIGRCLVDNYGADKIVFLPTSCYDPELGFKDFFKWKEDHTFADFIYEKIRYGNILLFDNPPFSIWTDLVKKHISPMGIDYILFGDSMTGINRVKAVGCGYRIMGRVPFENIESKKRVNISLFSNLWDDIEYLYGIGTDKADNSYGMEWSKDVNIQKYIDRDGEICSAEIMNVCLRNYVFKLNKFSKLHPTTGKRSTKFGGGMFYKF